MVDITVIREEEGGYSRRVVLRVPEHVWSMSYDQVLMCKVIENVYVPPEEREV